MSRPMSLPTSPTADASGDYGSPIHLDTTTSGGRVRGPLEEDPTDGFLHSHGEAAAAAKSKHRNVLPLSCHHHHDPNHYEKNTNANNTNRGSHQYLRHRHHHSQPSSSPLGGSATYHTAWRFAASDPLSPPPQTLLFSTVANPLTSKRYPHNAIAHDEVFWVSNSHMCADVMTPASAVDAHDHKCFATTLVSPGVSPLPSPLLRHGCDGGSAGLPTFADRQHANGYCCPHNSRTSAVEGTDSNTPQLPPQPPVSPASFVSHCVHYCSPESTPLQPGFVSPSFLSTASRDGEWGVGHAPGRSFALNGGGCGFTSPRFGYISCAEPPAAQGWGLQSTGTTMLMGAARVVPGYVVVPSPPSLAAHPRGRRNAFVTDSGLLHVSMGSYTNNRNIVVGASAMLSPASPKLMLADRHEANWLSPLAHHDRFLVSLHLSESVGGGTAECIRCLESETVRPEPMHDDLCFSSDVGLGIVDVSEKIAVLLAPRDSPLSPQFRHVAGGSESRGHTWGMSQIYLQKLEIAPYSPMEPMGDGAATVSSAASFRQPHVSWPPTFASPDQPRTTSTSSATGRGLMGSGTGSSPDRLPSCLPECDGDRYSCSPKSTWGEATFGFGGGGAQSVKGRLPKRVPSSNSVVSGCSSNRETTAGHSVRSSSQPSATDTYISCGTSSYGFPSPEAVSPIPDLGGN